MATGTAGAPFTVGEQPRAARIARALASPLGVLILLPTMVIAAGVVVLLLGRSATRDASDGMARRQLASQASDVEHDVAFALDQAGPVLDRMRALADPTLPIDEVGPRLVDLQVGRPGIANVSIGFPNGLLRGTFVPEGAHEIHVQESVLGPASTTRTNYKIVDGGVRALESKQTDYDVRKRDHYTLAITAKRRAWTPPRVYFTSKSTGITCTEPVYARDGALLAVITVDFDVSALSKFIARAPLEGARSVVFSGDGTILAFPSAPVPMAAIEQRRLLRQEDYGDPALAGLITQMDARQVRKLTFITIATGNGDYLASVAPVGGKRAGIDAQQLDWYLAALVPVKTLLGPTKRLEMQSLVASGGALFIALGVAVMFAWNLVRMRRDVTTARKRARDAEAKVREMGSYRLVARLGVGGMGEVWRAEHRLLARQAAVKLVRPDALTDPMHRRKARERFRREAQTLASMRSRHTIALFDYGITDDGTFFYVMELLDGLDLDKLVREHGPQPASRVIHLLVQACQSLAEAHEAGLLHRDIKPANIFVCRMADEVDIAKVLDFGIVHSIDDPIADPFELISLPPLEASLPASTKLTRDGAVIGTPGYIPPEQATGQRADQRSDLYALGCVAWWLLTASEVFARPDEESAILSHVNDAVPALRPRVRGWLPPELEMIVLRLLEKDPERRPANARALAAALREIEIPEEHAWTEHRAQAWWFTHRGATTVAETPEPASEQRILVTQPVDEVPTATGQRPPPASATVQASPRSR
ncbi:MAG: protein kinase [Kofleriaceae bacterium]|nr:protein kinase [Kofleriaceae bacterium]